MPERALILAFALLSLNAPAPFARAAEASGWLEAAIDGEHRSDENRARDRYRHPLETLQFFGLRPDMAVAEIWPGRGWYTEILGPALRHGRLLAASYGADAQPDYRPRQHAALVEMVAARPDLYGSVEIVEFDPVRGMSRLAAPGTLDMVVTFRNSHNWVEEGTEEEMFRAFFEALKPGGILGLVQHRAAADADPGRSAPSGYLPERYVIAQAKKAGFELEARSEINANPRDTRNYAEGVWTLPPALRLGEKDRARYVAIGESDRMTLRFVKPAAPAQPLADGDGLMAR